MFNGNSGAWMLSDTSLFFATFQGSAYSSNHGAPTYTNVGSLLKLQPVPASRIAVNDAGNLVAVVTPTAVYHVSCVTTSRYRAAFVFAPTALCAQPLSTTHSCSVSAKIGAAMSNVNDTAVSSDGDLWIACWSGLAYVPKPGSAYSTAAAAASAITWVVTSEPLYAVALRPDGKRVVTGGGNKFYIVDADPSSPTCVTSDKSCAGHVYVCPHPFLSCRPLLRAHRFAKVLRFEWVTIVYLGLGGVLDDTVTALEYDACGTLWIGNAVCLNVMYPNGTFARFDGLDVSTAEWCKPSCALPSHCSCTVLGDRGCHTATSPPLAVTMAACLALLRLVTCGWVQLPAWRVTQRRGTHVSLMLAHKSASGSTCGACAGYRAMA